jgi:hypothetical protein
MSDCDKMLGSKYTLVRRDQCRSRCEGVCACVCEQVEQYLVHERICT